MKSSQSNGALLQELAACAETMIFGTVSSTMRACGNPKCRCQKGGPKHGPFYQISFRGPEGKTTGYHVPRALEDGVQEGVAAWHRFQEIGRELAELNRERLWSEHKKARKRR